MSSNTKMQITIKSTVDVELVDHMGNDYAIMHAAMVSTLGSVMWEADKTPQTEAKCAGLINSLMKNRHGTPFEHNAMTFRVHAPIFVFREWHRHRIGWSYNEESARYKVLDPVFYIPDKDRPMIPMEGFKSMRPGFGPASTALYQDLYDILKYQYSAAYKDYFMLSKHFDRGIARALLPVGIYSSMYATCNARSLMHFLSLRTSNPEAETRSYPLWEIELAARAMESYFAAQFPLTYKAYVANGRVAP